MQHKQVMNIKTTLPRRHWSRLLCICWPVCVSLRVCVYIYIYTYIYIDFVRHRNLELCNPLSVLHHMARMGLGALQGPQETRRGRQREIGRVYFVQCVCFCVWLCVWVSDWVRWRKRRTLRNWFITVWNRRGVCVRECVKGLGFSEFAACQTDMILTMLYPR